MNRAPPRWEAESFASTSPLRARLAWVALMPPPLVAEPWAIVRPSIATLSAGVALVGAGGATTKTPLVPPPLRVRAPAPGPRIVRSLAIESGPPVRVIVEPRKAGAKLIVPPAPESAIAWRSEPAPASAAEVTVIVASRARPSRASSPGRKFLGDRSGRRSRP